MSEPNPNKKPKKNQIRTPFAPKQPVVQASPVSCPLDTALTLGKKKKKLKMFSHLELDFE